MPPARFPSPHELRIRVRRRRHESSHRPRPRPCREPVFQIEDYARKESSLSRPQQKSQQVKAPRAANQHHRRRNHSPDHHQQRNPPPRPHALQRQIARDLKKEVPRKKHSCAKPIDGVGERQLLPHLQRRKPDINPVQIGNDVEQKQKRHEPPSEPAHHHRLNLVLRLPLVPPSILCGNGFPPCSSVTPLCPLWLRFFQPKPSKNFRHDPS